MPQFQLISIGTSHYCEKARWALQRCITSLDEATHYPILHVFFAKKLGGGTSLPKLIITDDGEETRILHDSSDILAFTDTLIQDEKLKLYPAGKREAICEWEDLFDEVLGPQVRRWFYSHLLYQKGIYSLLSQGVLTWERIAGFPTLPFVQRALYKAMSCGNSDAKEMSFSKIAGVFRKVDEALADGRPFICGDTFTAADLTFASLSGPVVLPEGYGGGLPAIKDCPKEMVECVEQMRKSAAGQLVLKLYETERHKSAI